MKCGVIAADFAGSEYERCNAAGSDAGTTGSDAVTTGKDAVLVADMAMLGLMRTYGTAVTPPPLPPDVAAVADVSKDARFLSLLSNDVSCNCLSMLWAAGETHGGDAPSWSTPGMGR